jgi:hypothetical protein
VLLYGYAAENLGVFKNMYIIMIHIYGDSHAFNSFKGIKLDYKDKHCPSITMFRIGRDNIIINFDETDIRSSNELIIISYGEVDCRCHIHRQIASGKDEDHIIDELVNNYFITIIRNVPTYCKIMIVGVIPPSKQDDYESINGPVLHEFPFVGTDEDRVRYTRKVNNKIEELSLLYNYIYFNPYAYYTRDDGTLKYELSDKSVHLGDNTVFLDKFYEIYKSIMLDEATQN